MASKTKTAEGIINSMADKKDDKKDDKKEDKNNEQRDEIGAFLHTPLIHLIAKKWSYMTQTRLRKWNSMIKLQDLDFIIDLLELPDKALFDQNNKFPMKLYGILLDIKSTLPIIEIKFKSKTKGGIPKSKIEGYYIDCGKIINDQRVFLHINGGGMNDGKGQFVIYQLPSKKWAIHNINGTKKGYYWITCDESGRKVPDIPKLTWLYYSSDEKITIKFHLRIRSWNL